MKAKILKRKGRKPLYQKKFLLELAHKLFVENLTYKEITEIYGVNRTTLHYWMQVYASDIELMIAMSKGTVAVIEEKKEVAETSDIEQLRKELEEARLKIVALETMIDVAEKELNLDIRKKSGIKRSNN